MDPAALPANEIDRLNALSGLCILDTPAEERYDRITRLVAAHFGEPFVAINLIAANRQWAKSQVGGLGQELPRPISFCAYTILHDDLLVIEDTLADPRFRDSPVVIGPPQLRFYAAVPLHCPKGHAVGTLCVSGQRAHSFSSEQRQQLQDFAALVERELGATDLAAAMLAQEYSQARFRIAVEANLDSFVILESLRDSCGKIVDFTFAFANSRIDQIITMPREAVIGQRLRELLPMSCADGRFEKYVRVVETGVPIEEEFAGGSPDLLPAWIYHQVVPLGDGVAITSRDVTARREAEEAMLRTNTQLQEAVQRLERRTYDIMLLNELGELLLSCQTITEVSDVVALSLRTLLPRTMGVLYLEQNAGAALAVAASWGGYPAGPPLPREACWALRRQRVHYVSVGKPELFCPHSDADHRCESLCIPLRSQGRILGMLHVLSMRIDDIATSLDEAMRQLAMTVAEWASLALANLTLQRELLQQALHDPLTGLYNRRYLEQLAPQILAESANRGWQTSVITIDIDHFKHVNDRYGHAIGDQVIQAVAALLQGQISDGAIACRVGGEEFLMVLPQATCEGAVDLADQLRVWAAALHHTRKPSLPPITISAGVAVFPAHGKTVATLIAAADDALYRAKTGGRNQVAVAG
ncbi:MAG: diguanylate cyclase [Chloroflexales bacterium]